MHSTALSSRLSKPGKAGEIQLTDGIQELIERECEVRAVKLLHGELRLDIGTPETNWEAQNLCYQYFKKKINMRIEQ